MDNVLILKNRILDKISKIDKEDNSDLIKDLNLMNRLNKEVYNELIEYYKTSIRSTSINE